MFWLLFFLQTSISAIIAGVSFFRFRERDTGVRVIGLIFLISFLCNCAQYLCLISGIALVNQVATTYVFISIFSYTLWYCSALAVRFRRRLFTFSSLALLWGIVVVLFIQNSGENTTLVSLGVAFLLLAYSIFYFYRLMQDLPTIHLHRLPTFWFNSAFLIYSSGTIVVFASHDYLTRANVGIWVFHNGIFILSQLIVFIGLYYDFKKETNNHPTGTL